MPPAPVETLSVGRVEDRLLVSFQMVRCQQSVRIGRNVRQVAGRCEVAQARDPAPLGLAPNRRDDLGHR